MSLPTNELEARREWRYMLVKATPDNIRNAFARFYVEHPRDVERWAAHNDVYPMFTPSEADAEFISAEKKIDGVEVTVFARVERDA